jgi:hypothetical protein
MKERVSLLPFPTRRPNGEGWESGTDGTISDVHGISNGWLVMIGDFQSGGNFPSVPRYRPIPYATCSRQNEIIPHHAQSR